MSKLTRKRNKALGLGELIAIALGGMVGGGIFSILGVATENIGNATPVAILVGGVLALFSFAAAVRSLHLRFAVLESIHRTSRGCMSTLLYSHLSTD